jgi:predicted metal-dependent phosphoesterase TrpH
MIIDFHTHTYHSYDSLMRPEKILRIAKARGLDGIVICDHNTIKGGVEAKKLNKDPNFTVIVGAEIATDAGDITGIFLTREIKSRMFDEVVKEIKQQGGKTILNHPYKGHDLSKIDYSKIDYIEGYNSRLDELHNHKAVELALKYNIPVIAGSDSHLYAEIANCKTSVDNVDLLTPLGCEYKLSKQIYVTCSQYIKAIKRRSIKVFISATIIQIKYSLHFRRK